MAMFSLVQNQERILFEPTMIGLKFVSMQAILLLGLEMHTGELELQEHFRLWPELQNEYALLQQEVSESELPVQHKNSR